jgi:uncharacterized membrane protein YGL010W
MPVRIRLRYRIDGDLIEVISSQLTFYASYHSNPVNIAIHMVCIPMILWWARALENCRFFALAKDSRSELAPGFALL